MDVNSCFPVKVSYQIITIKGDEKSTFGAIKTDMRL